MLLTSSQLAQLIAQARADAPNETCGLISGQDDRARRIYPLKNVDENPRVGYRADSQELVNAIRKIEETRGEQVLAIYHSHPASPAYPSPDDSARAFYPDAIYIIISLQNPEAVQVRGFRIHGGQITEVTLEIAEELTNEQTRTRSRRHSKTARRSSTHRAVATFSKGRPQSRDARATRRRLSK